MGVGMPEGLLLEEFGTILSEAFDCDDVYHVGSSVMKKRGWRDVDVRVLLSDDQWKSMGLGDPLRPHSNAKWVAMTLAFTELGRKMTGLPIDFQLQQLSQANEEFPNGGRSWLGRVPRKYQSVGC